MVPRNVAPSVVVTMLYWFPVSYSAIRDFGEIGPAIAEASNTDPLFPNHLSGAEATACLLVAWAWEATRFMKNAAPSPSLGLYALRPPRGTSGSTVSIVKTASLVAIDRMREGMRLSEGRRWYERLAPFVAECRGKSGPTPDVVRTSVEVMMLMESLLRRNFRAAPLLDESHMFSVTIER